MIILKNISLKFDDKVIFSDFNFNVKKNEKIIITGSSGRGKTSLLNLILGFTLPDKGEIIIDDLKLYPKNIAKIRKLISYVPQNVNIPFNTGEEMFNAVFNYSQKELPDKNIVKKIFDDFELDTEVLKKKVPVLSGGEKQRILLISSILSKKQILLWDEPTSSLDSNSKDMLIKYLNNFDYTLISISHDKEFISAFNKKVEL